jgi:hypothetical protein
VGVACPKLPSSALDSAALPNKKKIAIQFSKNATKTIFALTLPFK